MSMPAPSSAADSGVEALRQAAVAAFAAGRAPEAERALQALLLRAPDDAMALNGLGVLRLAAGEAAIALPLFDRALAAAPGLVKAAANRALCLTRLDQPQAALAAWRQAIALAPDEPGYHADAGALAMRLGDAAAARAHFDRALAVDARCLAARVNRAALSRALGETGAALADLDQALAFAPELPEAILARGHVLEEAGRLAEALDCWRRVKDAEPTLPGAIAVTQLKLADWDGLDCAVGLAATPFVQLSLADDPALQRATAEAQARRDWPHPVPGRVPAATRQGPLRVAYVSADFADHPVAHLLAGVIERHDRARVVPLALDLGQDDGSAQRARILAAFDAVLPARGDDAALAEALRRAGADIVVDLGGPTRGARPGVLARRPAPVQMAWLGHPGTYGAPWLDYLIADAVVLPDRGAASEAALRLPDCFQPNAPAAPPPAPSRAALGLPQGAAVLANLHGLHKLQPAMFAAWLAVLRGAPDAVLWLAADAAPMARLRARAAAAGVDPARLIAAPRLPREAHLARLGAAELVLDTLPFNGGTSGSDALRAGVPLLTCPGRAFAARMGASLLRALDLPELIAADLPDYVGRATALARDPAALAALRARVRRQAATAPLFDTARFARHLEAGFAAAIARSRAGLPPADIDVAREP